MCRPTKRAKPVAAPSEGGGVETQQADTTPVEPSMWAKEGMADPFMYLPPFEEDSDVSSMSNDFPSLQTTSCKEESRPKTFVFITYDMVMNPENAAAIAFSPSGTAIEVRDTAILAEKILPKYFRHKNVTSFYRQLNSYGFRTARSTSDVAHTFVHETFRRDCPELLATIVRKKLAPTAAEKVSTAALAQAVNEQSQKEEPAVAPPKRQYTKSKPSSIPAMTATLNGEVDVMKMIEELKEFQRAQEERAVMLESRNKQLAEENKAILMEGEYVFKAMQRLVQDQTSAINKLFGSEASSAFEAQVKPRLGLEQTLSKASIATVKPSSSSSSSEQMTIDSHLPSDAELIMPDEDLKDLETLLSFEDFAGFDI